MRAAAQARAAAVVELEVARAKAFAQVYGLLTAEQKVTVAARRQEFEQRGPGPRPKSGPDGR